MLSCSCEAGKTNKIKLSRLPSRGAADLQASNSASGLLRRSPMEQKAVVEICTYTNRLILSTYSQMSYMSCVKSLFTV